MARVSTSQPCFYKFLTSIEDYTSLFEIPQKFVQKYGESLPSSVTLRINDYGKKSWKVGIEKIGEKYFFKDGWKAFAEEVDVKLQEYLIFKFLGLSENNQTPTHCKNKFCSGPMDKGKCEDEEERTTESDDDCDITDGRRWRFTKTLKQDDTEELEIPTSIAVESGIAMNRGIILQDEKGRTWPVRVSDEKCSRSVLSLGWYDFLVGNNVVVGDTVSLEFVSNPDFVIARVLKQGMNGKERSNSKEILDSPEISDDIKDRDFNEKIPRYGDEACGKGWTFTKKVNEFRAHRLRIPKKFAVDTGIAKSKRLVIMDADGNKWPVRVTDHKCGRYTMTGGWNAFLKANNVAVESTISFEFVSAEENLVKALVLERSSSDEDELRSSVNKGKKRLFSSFVTKGDHSPKDVETSEDEADIIDKNGFGDGRMWRFVKKLKECHCYRMWIPRYFTRGTGMEGKTKQLRDAKGRMWPIRLTTSKEGGYLSLSAGWNNFLVGNNVTVGSTVSFEFIPCNDRGVIETRVIGKGTEGKSYSNLQ